MTLQVDITVLSGISAGDIFHFKVEEGKKDITIGRSPDCDLVLEDLAVSRQHARIQLKYSKLELADLNSSHGTIHMGFQLGKGENNARGISDGDEFKVGESIFRINFDESLLEAKQENIAPSDRFAISTGERSSELVAKLRTLIRTPKGIVAILLLLLLFGMLLFYDGENTKVVQRNDVLRPAVGKTYGYIPRGDTKHPGYVTFALPGADLVVEYSLRNSSPIEVFLDDILIEKIQPNSLLFQHRELIIRDLLLGRERKLKFVNTQFENRDKSKGNILPSPWAVRNLRVVPIAKDFENSVTNRLQTAISVSEGINKSAAGLVNFIRVLQGLVLVMADEMGKDAVPVGVEMEASIPPMIEVQKLLRLISEERSRGLKPEVESRHLDAVVDLLGRHEAELWRLFNNRIKTAERAAKQKQWIVAHDNLLAIKSMFPDEADYRWIRANKMFEDKKIVPPRVRKRPEKFRKKLYD